MEFVYSDGGRSKYFKAENVGDCVTRAICNATGKDYKEVYDALKELAKHERITRRHPKQSSVRWGVSPRTIDKYMEIIGWKWHSCCTIGSTKRVHLVESEIPKGNLILRLSRHLTCTKDGVLYDTYDCTREGTRMVYGYWSKD